MPRSRSHSAGFARGPRRTSQWIVGPDAVDMSASASSAQLWTAGITTILANTIVRIRGIFQVNLLTASVAGAGFHGAIGIGLGPENGFVAGASSLPQAFLDDDWDGWMFHQFFDVRSVTATIGDGVNAATVSQKILIDSKAMRKWTPDEMILFGSVQVIESTEATVEFQGSTRVLVKLA